MAIGEMVELIKDLKEIPAQRDTAYNIIKRFK
jgi:2-iminoacetate synthase ThiH